MDGRYGKARSQKIQDKQWIEEATLVGTIVVPGCNAHSFRKHRYSATPWSVLARLSLVSPGPGGMSV
jgi:hypothetical protein